MFKRKDAKAAEIFILKNLCAFASLRLKYHLKVITLSSTGKNVLFSMSSAGAPKGI